MIKLFARLLRLFAFVVIVGAIPAVAVGPSKTGGGGLKCQNAVGVAATWIAP